MAATALDEDTGAVAEGRWTRAARLAYLAQQLHERSLRKNLTQADICRLSNMGRDSMSRYFRGMTLPDPLSLAALARALDCKPQDLDPGANVDMLPRAANDGPMIEARQDPADPSRMMLRIYRSVPISLAAKIMVLLEDERNAASST